MTTFIKLSLLSLMTISLSCDTAKSTASVEGTNTEKTLQMETETNLLNEGFSIGTVTYLKDSKCSYIIVDKKSGVKYDPINIDDEKYIAFKSDAKQIYYKCRFLRMKNRCNEAQPVQLTDIKSK